MTTLVHLKSTGSMYIYVNYMFGSGLSYIERMMLVGVPQWSQITYIILQNCLTALNYHCAYVYNLLCLWQFVAVHASWLPGAMFFSRTDQCGAYPCNPYGTNCHLQSILPVYSIQKRISFNASSGVQRAASPWRTLGIRSCRTFCSDLAW